MAATIACKSELTRASTDWLQGAIGVGHLVAIFLELFWMPYANLFFSPCSSGDEMQINRTQVICWHYVTVAEASGTCQKRRDFFIVAEDLRSSNVRHVCLSPPPLALLDCGSFGLALEH